MAASVLGKRVRETVSVAVTRSRKRVCDDFQNDENAKPASIFNNEDNQGSIRLDETALDISSVKIPRVALSPIKGNADCNTKLITPQTPRHRDALSKKAPVTPRHSFTTGTSLTPRTPRTPTTSRSVYNDARKVFTRGSNLGPIIGREDQRREARDFIEKHVSSKTGGCLYVSGPPGTGKSALIGEICNSIKDTAQISQSYVNCMSVQTASDIFNCIASELDTTDDVFGNEARQLLQLRFTGNITEEVSLVILDEVDQLLNLDLDVMYHLFELALHPHSKLLLIGIANALDLTDRFLPRLKARNLKPQLLPFLPYTAPEIACILKARARSLLPADTNVSLDFTPFFHPAAIQLISKKVATQNGDLRRAFDIAKNALDFVDNETKDKFRQSCMTQDSPSTKRSPLAENHNLSSPVSMQGSPLSKPPTKNSWVEDYAQLAVETAPRVTLAHVARVTTAAFGNGTSSRLKDLNLQQKAVLCSLTALEQKIRRSALVSTPPTTPSRKMKGGLSTNKSAMLCPPNVAPTIRALFDAYVTLCAKDNVMHALSNTEFRDVVGTLESLTLISTVNGKAGSLNSSAPSTPSKRGRNGFGSASATEEKRLSTCIGLQELEAAVEGVGSEILRSILSGEGF